MNNGNSNDWMDGEIHEVLPNIFFVSGAMCITKPVKMQFSRNMTVIREGETLTLVNTVKLNDKGLKKLDSLGKVVRVIRLAAFHGMDDGFYKERYNAEVLSVDAPYSKGVELNPTEDKIYFQPSSVLKNGNELPIVGTKIIEITSSHPNELLLYLKANNGTIISGDCLQNWQKTDKHFNFLGKLLMKVMGFIKPYNVGPGWRKYTKPDSHELESKLSLEFENVIPAHGAPVLGNASRLFKPAITRK